MEYIDVRWTHGNAEDPVRLVSELNDERNEVRKLEFFANGLVGFASAHHCSGGTWLGERPVPTLDDINADAQFSGVVIDATTFEKLWHHHVGSAV